MTDYVRLFREFFEKIGREEVIVYNEFSLQHELGIFLRDRVRDNLVQFERNISFFDIPKENSEKKEIDISIFSKDKKKLDCAIELKFPRHGQYPEQMYSFCKDISFMEHIKLNGFSNTFVLILVDDPLFYTGDYSKSPYSYFRSDCPLSGVVTKPTGKRDSILKIQGSYKIIWQQILDSLKFSIIEIKVKSSKN